jgi:WD40 repeat protein
MSDDPLSEQEAELEASLQQQMHEDEDEGEFYEEEGGQQQQQQQMPSDHYTDDPMGDYSHGDPSDPNLDNSMLHLNLAGGNVADDATEAAPTDFPVFKVGEMISRTRGVVSAIKCDKSNGHVYIGASTGEISLFDFNSGKEVWRRMITVEDRPLQITCLDIRSTKLALGGAEGETVIYDLENFSVTQIWKDHRQRVSAIAWVGESPMSHVYTTSHDGYFLVRDAEKKGKILHSFITCTCPLSAMQVESQNIVYIGSWDGQVKKLDLEKKQVVLVMKANVNKESPIRCFALAPSPAVKKTKKGAATSGEAPVFILFISHGIGEIKSWDMRTGKVYVESYLGCNDVVNAMTVWNGKLYAAGDDKYVRMFSISSGVLLESLSGHENGVTGLEIAGVTPVITAEMIEAQEAAAAMSHRSTARQKAAAERAASAPPQQGVGNELLMSIGFDGQLRSYKLAAIQAAIELKLMKMEEQKALAFENFVAAKTKVKGKKGSRKGSAKAKGSGKKKSSGTFSSTGSKKGSKAGSKASTARSGEKKSAKGDGAEKPTKPKKKSSKKKVKAAS